MNPTERAIQEAIRRYVHAPKAEVIDFFEARERLRQRKATRHWRRPTGPHSPGPKAA